MMLPFLRPYVPISVMLIAAMQFGTFTMSHAQEQKKASSSSKAQTTPAPAQAVETQKSEPAPYDDQLARLSEILGALQYIEGLCKVPLANDWRSEMGKFLTAEVSGDTQRQERFTAAYNRGYRSFAAVYTQCTDNAKAAELTYRHEGATLAQEITSRFGN